MKPATHLLITRKEAFGLALLGLLTLALPTTAFLVGQNTTPRTQAAEKFSFKFYDNANRTREISKTTNKTVRLKFKKPSNWTIAVAPRPSEQVASLFTAYAQNSCMDDENFAEWVTCPSDGQSYRCAGLDTDGQCRKPNSDEMVACMHSQGCTAFGAPAESSCETAGGREENGACYDGLAGVAQSQCSGANQKWFDARGDFARGCYQLRGQGAGDTPDQNSPAACEAAGGRSENYKCYDGIAEIRDKATCQDRGLKWMNARGNFKRGCYQERTTASGERIVIKKIVIKNKENGTGGSQEKTLNTSQEIQAAFNTDKGVEWNLVELGTNETEASRTVKATVYYNQGGNDRIEELSQKITLKKDSNAPNNQGNQGQGNSANANNNQVNNQNNNQTATRNNTANSVANTNQSSTDEADSDEDTDSETNSTSTNANNNQQNAARTTTQNTGSSVNQNFFTGRSGNTSTATGSASQASHLECISNACIQVTGNGTNSCDSQGNSCQNSATGQPLVTFKIDVRAACRENTFRVTAKEKGTSNIFEAGLMGGNGFSKSSTGMQIGKTYDVLVNSNGVLSKKVADVVVGAQTTVDFGKLLDGDVITGAAQDEKVDETDVNALLEQMKKLKNQDLRYDLNCDGQVEIMDYAIMIKNLNKTGDRL